MNAPVPAAATPERSLPPEKGSILLLAEGLRPSGLTRYARSLLQGLKQAGLSPCLAVPHGPPPGLFSAQEARSLNVFPGLLGSFFRPFAFPRLVAWARARRPNLIHGLSAFTLPVSQRLAKELNIPFVLSVQHYQERGAWRVDERCRRILACNEELRENLVNDARVPKERIQVLPVGVEIPGRIEAAQRARPSGRWALVATFAPLTPKQNVATFIRAARKIHDVRCGACQFLVVGEGPEESALRKLVRALKLENHLVFSHSDVPHEKILCDVDVYVQTARQEGFGVAVLEAMAWAHPVVATAVGGLLHLVQDGRTGYLVPTGDAGAVAAKTLELLGDAPLRLSMGRAGRERVLERFALPMMIQRTVEVYAETLKQDADRANRANRARGAERAGRSTVILPAVKS